MLLPWNVESTEASRATLARHPRFDWLARMGAVVLTPVGRSPDFDLVAHVKDRLLRIQVKTSTRRLTTPTGQTRSVVNLATCGGNQSWNGTAKKIDPSRFDYLFALTGDGRRWFIPSTMLEARSSITLGGQKYAEFEIDAAEPIDDLVYESEGSIESPAVAGEYPSGQRTATVNRQAQPSQVRILPPPFGSSKPFAASKYERSLGKKSQTIINQKRRVTIPQVACDEAGFHEDDRLLARSDGDGRVVLERIEPPPAALASLA